MVRILSSDGKRDGTIPVLCEFAGLSTDTKPTENLATGSTFLEVDTGDVFLFDEEGPTWNKVGGGNE